MSSPVLPILTISSYRPAGIQFEFVHRYENAIFKRFQNKYSSNVVVSGMWLYQR